MVAITNTFVSSSAKGNREELSDIVSRITPTDTPLYSTIEKESSSAIRSEWEIDALRAPAANAQAEGDQYAYTAITAPTRASNIQQIFREGWVISKSQEAVSNAGNVEKTKTAKLKAAIVVRKDVELALLTPTASKLTDPRNLGGLPTWLTTNTSRGASGANGGFNTGTGLTVAPTPGTQRAFTKTLLDTVLQACFTSGAMVEDVMVSPYVKTVFTTFMSDATVATFRYQADARRKTTAISTVDFYTGSFDTVAIIPNRVMATNANVARNVYALDYSKLSMKVLRAMGDDPDIATNADAKAGMIITEQTLAVKNEAGLGVVADVFGLTAST